MRARKNKPSLQTGEGKLWKEALTSELVSTYNLILRSAL
jgi:hypothetical protein